MELQILWFVLWAVLWAVYFMLDGFVLGTGMLHIFLGKNDGDRRVIINTIGPVWDGNEVWLITAGGATFAAFPTTYALMFSYLYTALLLLLFALIVRGVSFEFRGKEDSALWKRSWDFAIVVSSFLPALLFGVAFGNIFAGLPMDATGYHGSLIYLLNPYGLLTGILFVLLFLIHGALYLSVKTVGDLSRRAHAMADKLWPALLVVAVAFLGYTKFASRLYDNYFSAPYLLIVPLLAVAALLGIRILTAKGNLLGAFASSCVTILMVVFTGVIGLFPNLIPSNLDPAHSLTIFNSSSSPYTLKIMTLVVAMFLPIVIAYKIWVYRVFRGKVTVEEVLEDKQAY
ncbi:cytochrome d ubiquinol oxidase subunit II [Geotalea uraniireducens]|uniref:Cytochrome bd quinol oxidase subunit 2 apoprotein n=1 Tax=Geotalea uraniireducens (strain Rf4) TaxID=351605 RepID=A5G3I1_GEOUR|nr:cytochrome d ubiquinol oxidase subunit II [Geotalea uraniireducens]ABQ26349.1 cytochrome bd quinol oxidase subunit 2 apoprotein [Geotalea uraniireducens Rf4]